VAAQIGAQYGKITRQRGRDRLEKRQVDADRMQQQQMPALAIESMIELHGHRGTKPDSADHDVGPLLDHLESVLLCRHFTPRYVSVPLAVRAASVA
jgi:hypothetical protein